MIASHELLRYRPREMSVFARLSEALRPLVARERNDANAWVEPFNDVTRAVLYGERLPGTVVPPEPVAEEETRVAARQVEAPVAPPPAPSAESRETPATPPAAPAAEEPKRRWGRKRHAA